MPPYPRDFPGFDFGKTIKTIKKYQNPKPAIPRKTANARPFSFEFHCSSETCFRAADHSNCQHDLSSPKRVIFERDDENSGVPEEDGGTECCHPARDAQKESPGKEG